MSMICYVLRVSTALVSQVNGGAELWDGVMSRAVEAHGISQLEASMAHLPDDEKELRRERRAEDMAESLERLRAKYADVFAAGDKARARASHLSLAPALCLEKAWNAVDHVLGGDDGAGSLFVGEPAGNDKGYGPAFLRDSIATKEFAEILASRTADEHLERADLDQADRFYGFGPGTSLEEARAGVKEVFGFYLPVLIDYVAQAKRDGDGLLVWVS